MLQADRSGRADEYADAYEESELFEENNTLMSRPGINSRVSITTIQVQPFPPQHIYKSMCRCQNNSPSSQFLVGRVMSLCHDFSGEGGHALQELAVKQGTVTPSWWGLWILVKVRFCFCRKAPLQTQQPCANPHTVARACTALVTLCGVNPAIQKRPALPRLLHATEGTFC